MGEIKRGPNSELIKRDLSLVRCSINNSIYIIKVDLSICEKMCKALYVFLMSNIYRILR